MNIQVQCTCGAEYGFDFKAEDVPAGIQCVCAACGVDNSETATQAVRQQLAAAGISDAAPTASVTCAKHPGFSYVADCVVCHKQMCPRCLEAFGYVCSPYCKSRAEKSRIAVPRFGGERVAVERNYWRRVTLIASTGGTLCLLLLALWGWYSLVGSKPRVAWSVKLAPSEDGYCKVVAPGQLLVWHGDRLVRYDIDQRREVWSTPLVDQGRLLQQATNWLTQHGKDADLLLGKRDPWDPLSRPRKVEVSEVVEGLRAGFSVRLQVHLFGEFIWVLFPDHLGQFEWKTGKPGASVPFTERLERFETGEDSLFLITVDSLGRQNLSRVDPRSGQVTAERVSIDVSSSKMSRTELVNARQHFVLMTVRLVEEKMAQYSAMKERAAKSALDGEINAANAANVANEILNDWQRENNEGMRVEDESRYAVVLKRTGAAVSDWSGEVIGPPDLYALNTVDILAAGKSIQVFDKANKKLWESTLAFSMEQRSTVHDDPYSEHDPAVPAVERGDRLYFFDPGVLTCFELATGKVLWRLQAVGTSRLQFDEEGMLYVRATSAGVDMLRQSQQVDVTRQIKPLILKVHPANGSILWDIPRRAQVCRITGKFIYALEGSRGESGTLTRVATPEYMRLYRWESGSGRVLWEHYDKRLPVSWDCHDNVIPLLFRNELQILRFVAL
jgi:hypothetical protein